MRRDRLIPAAILCLVTAMVVWGLASSSLAAAANAEASRFDAGGVGEVELAQAAPAGGLAPGGAPAVPAPLVPGLTPAPVVPTPAVPTPKPATPAPTSPGVPEVMPGADAGGLLPRTGNPGDAGVGGIGALTPAEQGTRSVASTEQVADAVVQRLEDARVERRLETEHAVNQLAGISGQLATGDTDGVRQALEQAGDALGPHAQAQLAAAEQALDNEDLASARLYIDAAMGFGTR